MANHKTKVCYVLSYKSPDYIRTRVLVAALSNISDVELSTAINSSKSFLRYGQTLWLLLKVRLTEHPNVYVLGFRGQEIYWPVRLLTLGKPLIFDEFINMHDWLGEENDKLPGWLIRFADLYEKAVLITCRLILTDTRLGAESSHLSYRVPLDKYQSIYVGADERLFYPRAVSKHKADKLEVLFYGTMAQLHGLRYILEAAKLLKKEPIHFTIIGGKDKPNELKNIANYIKANSLENVTHKAWVNFDDLPNLMASCDIFLGGPFGDTSQSKRIITGKTYQALAVGTATVVGRIAEDNGFEDKLNCLLVEQGSSQALAEAIKWAANNRTQLTSIGKSGSKLYKDKFSVDQISNKLEEIIKTICA